MSRYGGGAGRAAAASVRIEAEVVVPVHWGRVRPDVEADFITHLARLGRWCDVTVVDGSQGAHAERRRQGWARHVRVLTPDPRVGGPNGKVRGSLTGIRAARHERVVIADDDVRYDRSQLAAVVRALHDADLVFPQDHPTSLPLWAWWESGRMLLNRAFSAGSPATCAVRRSVILGAGGWSADALDDNLEMARTVAAVGGRVVHRPDLLVPRRPPAPGDFLKQRVRHAYGDQARPLRLLLGLATVPTTLALAHRPRLLVAAALTVVAVAEAGRRRPGGRRVFPPHTPLAAPVWALERGVCTWLALVARARGGPVFHGLRVSVAAHSSAWLSAHVPYRSTARPAPHRRVTGLPPASRSVEPPAGVGRDYRAHRVSTSQQEHHMSEMPQQPTTELTEDEQKIVRSAAVRAGAMVAQAEPGFFDTFKESFAATDAVKAASPEVRELMTGGFPEMPSGGTDDVDARTLELLSQAVGILSRKAPQLVEEYRQVVLRSAKAVADAADGTSSKESTALGDIERALAG